jgi:hypothetical protein
MEHAGRMSTPGPVHLELSDETFIAAAPVLVAAAVADPERWPQWWPDLRFELARDRGPKGSQWSLSGAAAGTAEIYLEPWADGSVVHFFLRMEVPAEAARRPDRILAERTRRWKSTVTALKDELEQGRRPGTAARSAQVPPAS